MPKILKICWLTVSTGLEKVSIYSNPKEGQWQGMFRLPHTCTSFHMLAREYSKSIKLGFNSMWTENFHKYKLDLEKARGTRNQIANHHRITEKAREFQKNIYSVSLAKAFDCVDQNKMESSERDAKNRTPYLSLQKAVCRSRSNN